MDTKAIGQRPSLTIRRIYNSSLERLWQAWTDPQALKCWFAPNAAFEVPLAQADVRTGGRYRIVMRTPQGEEHDVSGVYREVVPLQKLVYTWAWKSTPERESLVTVQMRSVGEGTELTLVHEQFFDEAACGRHHEGWRGCLEHLAGYLAA